MIYVLDVLFEISEDIVTFGAKIRIPSLNSTMTPGSSADDRINVVGCSWQCVKLKQD